MDAQQLISTLQASLSDLSDHLSSSKSTNNVNVTTIFSTVQAAFGALESTILPSDVHIYRTTFLYQVPVALGVVVDLGLPEVISAATARGGQEEGISSKALERRTGVPWGKISRLLRLLCGRGFFREVRPDVWAHTRHSLALDSGLSYETIVQNPLQRFSMGDSTVPAWVNLMNDVTHKASVGMLDAFRHKKSVKSYSATDAPFTFAYGTDKTLWEWLYVVDGGHRMPNFMKAMEFTNSLMMTDMSLYPWAHLGPDAIFVDVGGGNGSAVASILPFASNIHKAIVQDLPPVIELAKSYWAGQHNSNLVRSEKVVLQAHDFFTEQPVKGAHAYFLKYIVHDWSDQAAITIMKHLYDAAADYSRLLVQDIVVSHACHDLGGVDHNAVDGAYPPAFLAPLPANGGLANENQLALDISVMQLLNGQERTHLHLKAIAAQAGWDPVKVYGLSHNGGATKITEFKKKLAKGDLKLVSKL
ncbi:hypothetical protein FRB95_001481 [Tulasnella sp. JGI-2019a]|nr:hypothetical protein FRB95_001481 [Tulasnella sp. JGI-2019a]